MKTDQLETPSIDESGDRAAALGIPGDLVSARTQGHPSAAIPSHRSTPWIWMLSWVLPLTAGLGTGYWLANRQAGVHERIRLDGAHAQSVDSEAIPVTTVPVAVRSVERAIEAVGTLHGYEELAIKTKVSGRVAKIHHDFADRLTPGEVLLEIDPTDARLAVEQAKKSLNSELAKWGFTEVPNPQADLTQLPTVVSARLRSEWTQSQYRRLLTLQSRGSVTAEELEQAKTNALVAESDYTNALLMARAGAATSQLKKSELDIAQQQLVETTIGAPQHQGESTDRPLRYTITDRYVTEGAWVAAGAELFRVVIDDTLKLRLPVPEKYASQVRVGQRVEVSTLTAAEAVSGIIARIGPAVDPSTRTFQVEVEVPNPRQVLKTGGFAKARIIIQESSEAQTVPVSALVTFAGIQKVFVVARDEAQPVTGEGEPQHTVRVKEYRVKLGEQSNDWVEIAEPRLPDGALVVTSGHRQLADKTHVRLTSSTAPPGKALGSESQPGDAGASR